MHTRLVKPHLIIQGRLKMLNAGQIALRPCHYYDNKPQTTTLKNKVWLMWQMMLKG